jgi:PsbP
MSRTALSLAAIPLVLAAGALLADQRQFPPTAPPVIPQEVTHKLPAGTVSADGRTYTDRVAGFSIRKPATLGWVLDVTPQATGAEVQIRSADGDRFINVGASDAGGPLRLEDAASKAPDLLPTQASAYLQLAAGFVGEGEKRCYEVRYQFGKAEAQRHGVLRLYVHGTNLLIVGAFAAEVRWASFEPTARQILDSFTLLPLPRRIGEGGRSYADERGFALTLPGQDWRFARRAGGLELLTLDSPDDVVHVLVRGSRVDGFPVLSSLGSHLEAGMKTNVVQHGFDAKVLRSEVVEKGGRRWYEIQMLKQGGGDSVREMIRLFLRDQKVYTISAAVPTDGWAAREPILLALFDSFTLTPPASGAAAP